MEKCALFYSLRVVTIAFVLIAAPATYLSAAPEDYAGTYTCTFDGALAGTAIVEVNQYGNVYGVIWPDQYDTADYIAGWARVDENGNFSFTSYCGVQLEGSIALTGDIDGSWRYHANSGTMTGQHDTGSIDAFMGSYSINVRGDVSGSGTFSVGQDGHITGQFQQKGGNDSDAVYLGLIDSQGNIMIVSEEGTGAKGHISSSGSVSGVWKNGSLSGTFSNNDNSGSGGSSGSSGGGGLGCFITALKIGP